MRILAMLIMFSVIAVSCSYRVTNNYNYYNCCPQQASWIDTIGFVGSYSIHAIGTRKDINYIFSQKTITTLRGFRVIEIVGKNYTVEVVNPNF